MTADPNWRELVAEWNGLNPGCFCPKCVAGNRLATALERLGEAAAVARGLLRDAEHAANGGYNPGGVPHIRDLIREAIGRLEPDDEVDAAIERFHDKVALRVAAEPFAKRGENPNAAIHEDDYQRIRQALHSRGEGEDV